MVGTKERASIKDLRELIEGPFPGYTVIGNKPYAKGCYIIKMGKIPIVVDFYAQNYGALAAITAPGYHPEGRRRRVARQKLIDFPETPLDMYLVLAKAKDHYQEALELLPLFGIKISETPLKTAKQRLKELRYGK